MQTNLKRPQRLFVQPVRYEIPAFQRRYVWTQEEQWEPLWNDVEELVQSIREDGQTEPHFMGAVVLQQMQTATATIERRIVVDGQQRLTTIQLLIDAVQEVLEERGYSEPAKRLSALVMNGKEYRDGNQDHAFKVWPTAVDRIAFRHAMSNDLSAADYAASRIVQAHEYFKGQAVQWLDRFPTNSGEHQSAASALEVAVSHSLEIVVIDLGEADDPHVIFETLNARGTPLLQSDMVKNKLLQDAGIGIRDEEVEATEKEKEIWPFDQDDWWAQEVGRGLQRRPRIDVYINHWLILRNRAVMKPYDEFRAFQRYADSRMSTDETIWDIARDLGELGAIYRDIEEVRRPDIQVFLERRNTMNVGVVTPLLLWLLSADLPPPQLSNCLTALESFLVRRVVCGYSARSYGELFVGLIQKLSKAPTSEADNVIVTFLEEQRAQAALWPGNEELRERFIEAPLYWYLTRGRLRMILEGIEQSLRSSKAESQLVPENLQIEHIMPQAWSPHWPLPDDQADNEEAFTKRDRVIHTLGNLTLVNGRLNPSLSNAGWESKVESLADHSVLFLNKQLVKEAPINWDEAAIEQRSKWLHAQAVEVWPHGKENILDK